MTDALICDGYPIAESITWASSPGERMSGLLGTDRISEGEALVIAGARQVHTFGMSYAIDVLFCDTNWVVRHRILNLRPQRLTKWVRSAWFVIELPGGAAADIRVGDRLECVPDA